MLTLPRMILFILTLAVLSDGTSSCWAVEPTLKFSSQRLSVDANEGIDVADVDNDGTLDLIAGRNWYRAPEFVPHPLRSVEDWNGYTTSNGDFAFDVNRDGWVDVIAGGFLQTEIFWYENPKLEGLRLGRLWEKKLLADTKLSQNEGAMMADLDADGTPELVVNSWNKTNPMCAWKLSWDAADKNAVPMMTRMLIGERGNGHGMAIGDLNNDGRVDVLVGEGWYEQPAESAVADRWIYHTDWTDWRAAVPCVVHDVNQDGKNDIIWAKGHDYGIFWWEITGQNEDGSLAWKEHEIDRSFSQAHALELADIDGDGELELITGKRFRAHNGKDPGGTEPMGLFYYNWDRETLKFTRKPIDTSNTIGIGLQPRIVDLNGDGRLDIAVAGKSGTYVIINEGLAE